MTCRYGAPRVRDPHDDDRDNLTDGVLCSRVVTTSPFRVVGSREASADGSGRCIAGRRRARQSITPQEARTLGAALLIAAHAAERAWLG